MFYFSALALSSSSVFLAFVCYHSASISIFLVIFATLELLYPDSNYSFTFIFPESTAALHITSHSIPASVDGSNRSQAVTLDCRYAFDGSDLKLVVRWFHNDSPEPIYQWIPEPDVRYIGELIRPYFDVDYQVPGGDRFSKYRALRLLGRLPVTLSGNYTCVISSIAATVDHRGLMVVYGKSLFVLKNVVIFLTLCFLQCLQLPLTFASSSLTVAAAPVTPSPSSAPSPASTRDRCSPSPRRPAPTPPTDTGRRR